VFLANSPHFASGKRVGVSLLEITSRRVQL